MLPVILLVAAAIFGGVSFASSAAPKDSVTSEAAPCGVSDGNAANVRGSGSHSGSAVAEDDDAFSPDPAKASDDVAARDQDDEEASQDSSGHDDGQTGAPVSRKERDADDNGCQATDSISAQKDSSDQSGADEDSDDDTDSTDGRSTLTTRLEHYHDSEGANTVTVTSTASKSIDDFSVTLHKVTVRAHDSFGSQRSEALATSVQRDLSEMFSVEGKLGSVRSLGSNGWLGSFQATANLLGATISAGVGRDFLTDSAQTMRTNVWRTDFGLDLSYELNEHLSSELEVHRKLYTDRNSSNEVDWSPKYSFDLAGSKLAVGYHFTYTGFARNTDDIYWAPQLALSHNAFAKWSYNWGKAYARLELEMGRGSVRQSKAEDVSRGNDGNVKAVLGLRPAKDMTIEYIWSTDRSPGWNSTSSGFFLKYTF
jgi:hypothetical protein